MSTEIPRNESSPEQEKQDTFKVPLSSSDFGDLSLYEFLQWHISVCGRCEAGQHMPPPPFGKPDERHCQDYYAIVQEYSDYERDYISRANP